LQQAQGYIATEVKCESPPGVGNVWQYRVRDFWREHRGFEIYRERFSEDFAQFDQQVVDELIEQQEFVGAYYEADEHE
jgi:RecB family exonuclease